MHCEVLHNRRSPMAIDALYDNPQVPAAVSVPGGEDLYDLPQLKDTR